MKEKLKINKLKVVILAGGFGTRLSEHTKDIPKPMIKIKKQPIICHIIKSYENRNYNGNIISRLFNFYYCKSSCCVEADDGNPFTNNPGIIELIKYNIGAQTEDTQIQIDESIQTDEIINLNN